MVHVYTQWIEIIRQISKLMNINCLNVAFHKWQHFVYMYLYVMLTRQGFVLLFLPLGTMNAEPDFALS